MKNRVLVDTGPLVAILSKADEHHLTCVKALRQLPGPLLTCWPVIDEAAWLLRSHPRAVRQLLQSCSPEKPFLELLPLTGADANAIAEIMKDNRERRPTLADAALMHLANREGIETVFTLDRRDFALYRAASRRAFCIVP